MTRRSLLIIHVRHHTRFYSAALFGVLLGVLPLDLHPAARLMLAGDGFFALYLLLVGIMARRLSPGGMRRRASIEDVGMALIVLITVVEIVVSLASIFALINRSGG